MSCYHPILGYPDYSRRSKDGNFIYKLGGSYHPEYKLDDPNVIKIPCGHCLGCQLDKARSWSDRMMLELLANDCKGIFVTLTYNNDHVPFSVSEEGEVNGFSLCKRDLQLYHKRLRWSFPDSQIRFYACGEYGKKTTRPHYHEIIFGLDLGNFDDLYQIGMNELGQIYYSSKFLESIWQNGYVMLSGVSMKTCNYVARYCMKKAFDQDLLDGQLPEFHIMSRKPGIGYPYYVSHPELFQSDKIFGSDSSGQFKISIPSYFWDKLKLDRPDDYDRIKIDRSSQFNDRELLKLQRTNLSYVDMLELEEERLFNKTKILFNLRER